MRTVLTKTVSPCVILTMTKNETPAVIRPIFETTEGETFFLSKCFENKIAPLSAKRKPKRSRLPVS